MKNNKITWQENPLDDKDKNDVRFKKCMEIINSLKPGDLTELMGEKFMEEFKRIASR
jgi:hypothetical protein